VPDPDGTALVDRRRLALALLAGSAFAIIVIGIASHGHTDRMIFGDGRMYRAVASDLDANDPTIQEFIRTRGTSLRYGRIGLPVLIWVASAGKTGAMPYAQPAVLVAASAAIAGAASILIPRGSPLVALAPFAAVGLTVSLTGGFAEPVAIAASMWAVVAARRDAPWTAAAFLSVAMLTRENALAVLLGLVVWYSLRREHKRAVVLAASLVPVATWYAIVVERFGHLPFLDPWLSQVSSSLGTPVFALWDPLTNRGIGSSLSVLAHLALAGFALTRWRTSDMGTVAAACGLSVLFLGYDVWRFIGDATRVSSLLEVFVVVIVVDRLTLRDSARAAAAP
jgi:hypothetical protein